MSRPGTASTPLHLAIVGSGPAAFYVAEALIKQLGETVRIDMFERLPSPHGLVRFGVAPDHQKIKQVTRVFDKAATSPGFRFFGNVEYGTDVDLATLTDLYHFVCFATGAQADRRLGIPGEALARSHPATEFVAWYNGHPDFRDREFDLSVETAAVIGVGNVAVDVARILCRTAEELAQTDIAEYALEALRASRIKTVVMLGRRGPAQAAFTNVEVRELGQLPGADCLIAPDDLVLDPESAAALDATPDREVKKKLEILQEIADRPPEGRARRLILRFLVSPVELVGNASGEVVGMRLVRNTLVRGAKGRLRATPTDVTEDLDAGLVFRSVGYHGVALPGLPFDPARGIVPNAGGRVIDGEAPMTGVYVSGWIKRGPTGVIGTNKPDAKETVEAMLEDLAGGLTLRPGAVDPVAIERHLNAKGVRAVSFPEWQRLDELEVARGAPLGRPRCKFTSVEEMLTQLES